MSLGRAEGDGGDLLHGALDGVRGAGLGTDTAGSGLGVLQAGVVRLLHLVSGAAPSRAVDVLLLGAPLLATLTAYAAAGAATRSRALRTWAALTWGLAPVLATGVGGGRLGPVVAHVLVPLVAAALARALGAGAVDRVRGGGPTAAACAAALGLAVLGGLVPVWLVAGLLVALGGLLAGRGATRLRALAVLVLAPALLGPWLLQVAGHPALLLAGPGALADGAAAGGWDGLLDVAAGAVPLPLDLPRWVAAVLLALPLLPGVVVLVRGGRRGRVAGAAWLLGVLGLALALLAPHLVLASTATSRPVHALPATGLSLLLLGALVAVLSGADGLRARLVGHGLGWRRSCSRRSCSWRCSPPSSPVRPGCSPAPPDRSTASPRPRCPPWPPTRRPARPPSARSCSTRPATAPRCATGWPVASPRRGRATSAAPGTPTRAAAAAPPPSRLPSRRSPRRNRTCRPPSRCSAGSGWASCSSRHRCRPTSSARSTRRPAWPGSGPRRPGRWRVDGAGSPQTARARVLDAGGEPVATVPTSGPHARVDTRSVPAAGGTLVLAEQASPRFTATLDGRRLTPVAGPDGWQQAFALPAGDPGRHLVVRSSDPAASRWRLAQLVLLGLVLLLALPVRREPAARPDGEPA
ncbi:hypothetical protein GCM10025868_36750 [Angustibacter aerolatus]|uniref:Glycosyltransferase RgtA/B/C/D-like domain-containing protein n=1 Tax=Angustibacter aerolatus TaxID=1162965 RepID=A0ABQ6JJJ4_9ACTN|nr:hypothetical protein [Angustibacter aerolatus]GMA88425.1 hypothetical protein GCM10025868_36750 [Angustibacter aerolatus]